MVYIAHKGVRDMHMYVMEFQEQGDLELTATLEEWCAAMSLPTI